MSEMVERVSEAIFGAILDDIGTIDFRIEPVARAAIGAMREPTREMVDAAYSRTHDFNQGYMHETWRTMIDAALEPAEKVTE